MKLSCFSKIVFLLITLVFSLRAQEPAVGFYYGSEPTNVMINQYDWFVVDPAQLHPVWVKRYPDKLFAYVSVGEIQDWRHRGLDIPDTWKLGTNSAWGTAVADLSNPKYQDFLLQQMVKLQHLGYRNFFLDTLDSIFGIKMNAAQKKTQTAALSQILLRIRARFPKAKILANRGVEVMDTLCQSVNGFVIESLYQGIDTKNMRYKTVPSKDRAWIKTQLDKAKACHLKAISIDYVDPSNQKLRAQTAQKIAADGYIPFVSDIHLKYPGNGKDIPLKREVLLLYDSKTLKDHDKVYSNMHLMVSMPLEYMGYIPVLKDIQKGLPEAGTQRYSGVIIWPNEQAQNQKKFFHWIKNLISHGQKVLFLNDFGFEMTPERAKALGLGYKPSTGSSEGLAKIVHQSNIVGYELPSAVQNLSWLPTAHHAQVLIQAANDKGEHFDAAAIMPWGGYAIGGSAEMDIGTEPHWMIDPFPLFERALKLPKLPVPDPTTENGKRILFIHLDGDGFIEKARFAPKKYACEVLYKDILKRYKLPHSVSIIEGEIGEKGLYPKLAPRMQKTARKIFSMPFVEPASHTYSHPFKWQKLGNEQRHNKKDEGAYHLPIPGYQFDLKREIKGSLSFINTKLLSKGKKCKLLFWSGDCLPFEDALWMCEKDNIKAINGGDTTITKANPWLGRIAPFGLQRGDFRQIYVGEQNENIYTHDWLGPFWGYRKVIETFELTESPRRLKPVDVYYHFYSASKTASLDALHRVYKWVLTQPLNPMYTSEYIDIVHDFYATALSKDHDTYIIKNYGALRTLRLAKEMGYPDLAHSKGIIGFKDAKKVRYVHLDGTGDYRLKLMKSKPKTPYLIDANGRCDRMQKEGKQTQFVLHAHVPLKMHFYQPKGCKVQIIGKGFHTARTHKILSIQSQYAKKAEVHFVCP